MMERNENRYQLEQDNKTYFLTTSLIKDKIKLVCQDPNNQIYDGEFNMSELISISKYFQPNHTVEQIQMYLNGIIEKQRVRITQNDAALSVVLLLINKDQICIPLTKRIANNAFNYNNYSNYNISQNIGTTNEYIQGQQKNILIQPSSNQYFNNNANIVQDNVNNIGNIPPHLLYQNNPNQQYLNLIQNQKQQQYFVNAGSKNETTKKQIKENIPSNPVAQRGQIAINQNKIQVNSNQLASSKNENQITRANSSSVSNYAYKFDENKLGKLEDDTNIIRAGQEKLKNDMKRLIEEASKLREQNQKYKVDQDALIKENEALKNENENYKKQIISFQNENKGLQELQEENNNLRNQVDSLNKDFYAVDNQNNEIRKMYEELENESNNYKLQIEELSKENEMLRAQVEELNNNFTLINNELENIKNENNLFKNNLEEQQKNNMNEELINKIIEENNIYKQKAEENELLRKQIEELQFQLQNGQERQEEDDQGKEVKGDIIHDIKELEMITKKINKDEDKRIIINLLYKASVDGDKASAFHEKCDDAQNTIVLVETKNGKRFGGFTTCSWSGNCVDKNDPQAFIFSFDKMKTYDNIPGDEAIGCYPKFGPIFLGCQIKIFDNAFTKGGTTFEKELNFNTEEDYELTGGDRVFEVKDIEVYEVILE